MINVTIYQQECFGTEHWRVMRNDGYRIFDALQVDFDSEQTAIDAVTAEFRRKQLGPGRITIHYIDFQAAGKRRPCKTIDI